LWLKSGGPPSKRSTPVEEQIDEERWQERIGGLLSQGPQLAARFARAATR
jgi:hypothetical protein